MNWEKCFAVNRRLTLRALFSGVIAVVPTSSRAQRSRRPVVGFLNNQSPERWQRLLAGFHRGLGEGSFTEGQTVDVEYRWAQGRNDRLQHLAADLVAQNVDVIVATGGHDPVFAAKSATTVIPIVFSFGGDPVKLGFVQSLARPGGNVTGFSLFTNLLGPKRFGFLSELVPGTAPIAMLINPDNTVADDQIAELEQTARSFGERLSIKRARDEAEIEGAFQTAVAEKAKAMFVASDAQYFARPAVLASTAARHRLPTSFEARNFVEAGGLMSYGADFAEVYRQVGLYAARILKGEKPSDLSVQQPTRFELLLNLKTARALGLAVPPAILARANEVIE